MNQLTLLRANRNFKNVFLGTILTSFFGRMFTFLIPIWVYEATKSDVYVSASNVVTMVATLVVGVMSGVYIDRHSKKNLLVWTQLLTALVLLLPLISENLFNQPLLILSLIFIITGLSRIMYTTRVAIINTIVSKDELITANSMMASLFSFSMVLGPSALGAGLLIIGYQGFFWVSVALFFLSAAFSLRLVLDESKVKIKPKKGLITEITEGWQLLKGNRALFGSLLFTTIFMFSASIISGLIYLFLIDHEPDSAKIFTISASIQGVGSILGSILVTKVSKLQVHRITAGTVFAIGLLDMVFLLFYSTATLLVVCFLNGILQQVTMILMGTLYQKNCPNEFVGRLVGFRQTFINLFSILAVTIAMALLVWFSPTSVMIAASVLILLSAGFGFRYVRDSTTTER
ncbi:MFS transporter [Tumebacillus lipolyticus]|uniref:MFS transporter n=1 Tax=Tumebacillus lipolyticus TaxID=1280370 RepID=A0ABW4ZZB6_9BACL